MQHQGIDAGDARALAALDLPDSLRSLILSRIDTLEEPLRRTLKVASVVGRVFSARDLPGAVPDVGDVDLVRAHLRTLGEHDLVQLDRAEDEAYAFKHVVTQEAAYESMPFALRARLHVRVGTFLEETQPDAIDRNLDLLAHHFWHGDDEERKRGYLRRAGEAAQAAYANEAAIDYFERLAPLLEGAERVAGPAAAERRPGAGGQLGPRGGGRHRVARARGVRRRATARRAGPRPRSPRSPASTAATRTRARTWSAPRRASPPPARTTAPGASCTSPARSPPSAGRSTRPARTTRRASPSASASRTPPPSAASTATSAWWPSTTATTTLRARSTSARWPCASRSATAGASACRRPNLGMIATLPGALGGRRRALRGGDAPEPRDRRRLDGRHRPQQPRQLGPRPRRPRSGADALRGEPGCVRGLRRPLGDGLPAGGHRRPRGRRRRARTSRWSSPARPTACARRSAPHARRRSRKDWPIG